MIATSRLCSLPWRLRCAARVEGHAYSNFVRAARHGIRGDAVGTDGGEGEPEKTEKLGNARTEAFAIEIGGALILQPFKLARNNSPNVCVQRTEHHAPTNRKALQALPQWNAGARRRLAIRPARHVRTAWSQWCRQVHANANAGDPPGSRQRQRAPRRHRRVATKRRSAQTPGIFAAGVRALSQSVG